MKLKYVIPNMEKTFGQLELAGTGDIEQKRINGRMTVVSRVFNLYSPVQKADDIEVMLPGSVGEKRIEPDTPVILINPRIEVEGYKIEEQGFTRYILRADDMIKVESEGKKV